MQNGGKEIAYLQKNEKEILIGRTMKPTSDWRGKKKENSFVVGNIIIRNG